MATSGPEREFFIDNLLVRTHFIIVIIRWTGLAPWEIESPFAGSLTSTFLVAGTFTSGTYGLSDYSEVGISGLRYKNDNSAGTSGPVSPNWTFMS